VRIVLALLFALVTVSLADLAALVAAFAAAVLLAGLARLPPGRTARRLLALDGFMVAILVLLPFTVPGEPVAMLGPWPLSGAGLAEAAAILLTANSVVLAVLALVGTIEPALLGNALAGLGVPDKLTRLLVLTTRYIDVLGQEFTRLRLAMKARAFRPRGNLHTWRSYGYLFGMLLVRSFERSERILGAMKCRGYVGRPVAPPPLPPPPADLAVGGACGLLLLVLGVAGRL
jgi:cobalt/nickel transport system permease protein